jgi:hypothetical protein
MLAEKGQHRVSGLIHQYTFLLSTLIMLFQLNSMQIWLTDVLDKHHIRQLQNLYTIVTTQIKQTHTNNRTKQSTKIRLKIKHKLAK